MQSSVFLLAFSTVLCAKFKHVKNQFGWNVFDEEINLFLFSSLWTTMISEKLTLQIIAPLRITEMTTWRLRAFIWKSQYFLYLSGLKIPSSIIPSYDLFQSLLRFLDSNYRKRWTLCYRASSHGWAASTFHSRCDGKPHTVTIIRKSPYVFGGYTNIAWGENIGLFREWI